MLYQASASYRPPADPLRRVPSGANLPLVELHPATTTEKAALSTEEFDELDFNLYQQSQHPPSASASGAGDKAAVGSPPRSPPSEAYESRLPALLIEDGKGPAAAPPDEAAASTSASPSPPPSGSASLVGDDGNLRADWRMSQSFPSEEGQQAAAAAAKHGNARPPPPPTEIDFKQEYAKFRTWADAQIKAKPLSERVSGARMIQEVRKILFPETMSKAVESR